MIGSLAQVAGQYVFLLVGAEGIGSAPADWRVLLAGLGWLALMTVVCCRGMEVAAAVQRALLFLEFGMLLVLSVVALVRVYTGTAPAGYQRPHWSWLNPFEGASMSAFAGGLVLMLFISWGWETALTVNEALYLVATFAAISFAGIGATRRAPPGRDRPGGRVRRAPRSGRPAGAFASCSSTASASASAQ
ncbi:hypothetical protein ACWC4D_29645 [Streptomyces sp. NPDC001288]|uniref:hypothetical protein n=1 Tax=unclassified Streptomyces TaxID=2593676 RepID=UPI0033339F3D